MKKSKYIVIGLILFLSLFVLIFSLSEKNEYFVVDNYVQEGRVYVTKYGECYHSYDCHYLRHSRIEKGIYQAQSQGYTTCSYCNGIPYGSIEVNYRISETEDVRGKVAIKSVVCASIVVAIYIAFVFKKNIITN